jgi:plastocyanin
MYEDPRRTHQSGERRWRGHHVQIEIRLRNFQNEAFLSTIVSKKSKMLTKLANNIKFVDRIRFFVYTFYNIFGLILLFFRKENFPQIGGFFVMRPYISLFMISCVTTCLGLSGCGGGGGGGGATSRATVVFSGEGTLTRASDITITDLRGTTLPSDVDEADIESLTLTITEIEFKYDGPVESDGGDEENTVTVSADAFDPASITIEVGQTVRWVWDADGLHTVTSGAVGDEDAGSLFDMAADSAEDVIELLFTEVGVFPYFSDTDADIENGMSGVVEVVESIEEEMPPRGEDEEEGDDDGSSFITVFAGSIDVNILDLTLFDLNEIITNVVLPAGQYKGARLHIENPRLVLRSDPDTVIVDVHLTANGRLFIKHDFFLPGGEEAVVKIQFGDIHLVITGSGKFVLTPHLRIVTNDGPVEAEFKGEIIGIAEDKTSITVEHKFSFSSWVVLIDKGTSIFEEVDDMESPLTVDELDIGQCVEIEGILNEDNTVTAHEIEVEIDAVPEI